MRIALVGDHSGYHCGCDAVMAGLRLLLRPHEIVGEGEDFDALVVNGEGSMHHDQPHFVAKMEAIVAAQAMGRKTYLVNTVWQDNSGRFDAALARLDGLVTRGPRSSADLRTRHGIEAPYALDLSYFAPVRPAAPAIDYGGATVVTDFWVEEQRGFMRATSGPLAAMPYFDLGAHDWDVAVATLKTAGLIVTGRHHAVYLACRARVPFVALRGNTHKVEDLIEAAPVALPVCASRDELMAAVRLKAAQRQACEALFDWMEQQPPPDLLAPRGDAMTAAAKPAPGGEPARLFRLGRAATLRGDSVAATAHYADAARLGHRVAGAALARGAARGGRGDLAARILIDGLSATAPAAAGEILGQIKSLGADAAGWPNAAAADAPAWWLAALEIDELCRNGALETATARALALLDGLADPAVREAARLALWARAFNGWHVVLVDALQAWPDGGVRPAWFARLCGLYYAGRRRIYSAAALSAARGELAAPTLASEALQALLFEQLWLAGEDPGALVDFAEPLAHAAPEAAPTLGVRLVAAALAAGQHDRAHALAARLDLPASLADPSLALRVEIAGRASPALARLYREREARAAQLMDRLADRRRSIAIVGNGPITGADVGRRIDGHDIVIRFNDFLLDDTSGQRVDLNATVLHGLADLGQPRLGAARLGSVLMPALMPFLPTQWGHVERLAAMGHTMTFIPAPARHALERALGGPPSSGLLVATLLADLRGGLDGIGIYGMPLLAGDAVSERRPGGTAHSRHDWQAEAEAFGRLFNGG